MVLATIDSFLSLVSTVHFTLSDDTVRVQKNAKHGPRFTSLPFLGNVLFLDFKAKDLNEAYQGKVE